MKWTINSLMVTNDAAPDMVTMTNFTLSDTQDGLSGQVSYSLNLLPADPQNYTPYNQVTEAQAIQWTQEAAGAARIASWEKEVQDQIDAQRIPTPQPAPLPWADPVTESTESTE
tara:strand:- start:81 stop:422 length:342 start_codon:yes stop_codon:yes gene_type:complete